MAAGFEPKLAILIVAAGRGERAGSTSDGPKQYRCIGGRPVISRAIEQFLAWDRAARIIVAIHPDDQNLFADCLKNMKDAALVTSVFGGPSRQQSVLLGLEALADSGMTHVFIHDAARPFFSLKLLDRILAAHGNGEIAVLPAVAVPDTLKRGSSQGYVTQTIPRDGLYAAQTPQSFEFEVILEAHRAAKAAARTDFTDDASLAEWQGIAVKLVDGESGNVKLTLKEDFAMAEERLSEAPTIDVRTGNGYDVHQLTSGDGVTLCGIKIPHDKMLLGHSDADVAYHALTDALLATCGQGDIGDHFPPSDPQWKGAASSIFLAYAVKIVKDRGGSILNADISLIAEAPRIGPHRQEMREHMASVLGISLDRCSVKATTNEKLGFVGREEGIAAIATATVSYGKECQ